jgi:hypothetical protein
VDLPVQLVQRVELAPPERKVMLAFAVLQVLLAQLVLHLLFLDLPVLKVLQAPPVRTQQ